ncbi:hypothetical protein CFC21_053495 [Triticum aestivum]|uniref:Uncharacterized protein n=3 Tax=Triticum TaxID=4564 RepID=A0A9R0SJI5_TRITD|nr:hypothetical protein CFC21_053495 [Triticum aestivum]VAH95314.1 unnamed protein product [Triticum turgidum subsp. durum]
MAIPKALLLAILGSICLCSSTVLSARELGDAAMVEKHEQWMAKFNHVYKDSTEKAQRFEVFKANVAFIESFNTENHKFWLGVNQFTGLTNDEFRAIKTNKGLRRNDARAPTGFEYNNVSNDALPAAADWRTKGVVVVGLFQPWLQPRGCAGGEMHDAFKFIIKNGGLTTEANYPYTAQDGQCKTSTASNSVATIKGYEDVPANNESSLMKAVANQPVSVAMDGGDVIFQHLSGGVMTGSCGTDLDHGIVAIGYGMTSDGTKFWLLKNSWGTTWGESGYLRMEKDIYDKSGMCGLAMQPSYPTE